ncbi:MAG: Acetokinase family [Baekduia sp.]|jgi:hypothetical protein|nr:Acetokinase family [Baekduia sp.]
MAEDLPAANVLAMPAPPELVAIPALDPGVALDPRRNAAAAGNADLSAPGSTVRTTVIAAREDLEIAFQVHQLLGNNTNKESTDDLDVLRRVS